MFVCTAVECQGRVHWAAAGQPARVARKPGALPHTPHATQEQVRAVLLDVVMGERVYMRTVLNEWEACVAVGVAAPSCAGGYPYLSWPVGQFTQR